MKLNLKRLNSIKTTLQAIDEIEKALEMYVDDFPSPVHMFVQHPSAPGTGSIQIQFDRTHFRKFMNERKQELIKHLEDRFEGFEYDPEASWVGDKEEEKMIELLTAAWMLFLFVVWQKDTNLNIAINLIFLAFGIVWSVKAAAAFGYIIQI